MTETGSGGRPGPSEPGPLADEAAKLFGAAQDWIQRTLSDASSGHIATGAPECQWCPLCQLIALLRGQRPAVAERMGEVQTALAGLLHAVGDSMTAQSPDRPPGPRVHKIDLGAESADAGDGAGS